VQILEACTEDYIVQNLAPVNWIVYIVHRNLVIVYCNSTYPQPHLHHHRDRQPHLDSEMPLCSIEKQIIAHYLNILDVEQCSHNTLTLQAYMNEASGELGQLLINLLDSQPLSGSGPGSRSVVIINFISGIYNPQSLAQLTD